MENTTNAAVGDKAVGKFVNGKKCQLQKTNLINFLLTHHYNIRHLKMLLLYGQRGPRAAIRYVIASSAGRP